MPGDRRISFNEWNIVVDRHLDGFKPVLEDKFKRDDWTPYKAFGQSYPKIVITLQDIQRRAHRVSVLDGRT